MVVHCGRYLSQSVRHHAARAMAVELACGRLQRLCDKARNKTCKQHKENVVKLRRVKAMGQVLRGPTMQLPLLVNDLLHMPAGYQSGCLVLQETMAVFFRLHLCAAQMWWQLMFLGCSQWERQRLIDRILVGRQASLQLAKKEWTFRCRFCGLLRQRAESMVDHFRLCHSDSSWIYATKQDNYQPQRLRRAIVDASVAPMITRLKVGADAFAGLALRQPGSMVTSLETAGAYAVVFANLLAHVDWGEDISTATLHWTTWVSFVWAALPGRVWRVCPTFWH